MFESIRKILAKQLRIDASKIELGSKFKGDLGADSLDILQLLMTLEEDYGLEIPEEKLATFETVGDLVAYLEEKKIKIKK